MKWIRRLEYKYSKFQIPHLTKTLLVGMLAVFVINLFAVAVNPFFMETLALSRAPIFRGEIWRLLTFIFIPGTYGISIGSAIYFYFFYFIANTLESSWSGFRYTLYFLMGVICAILCMLVTGTGSNYYIYLSFVLAFASINPNQRIYIFYFIPVKIKWLAIIYGLGVVYELYTSFMFSAQMGVNNLIAALFGLVPYLLFFGDDLWNGAVDAIRVKQNQRQWRQKNR